MSGVTILSTTPAYEPFMTHPFLTFVVMVLALIIGIVFMVKFDSVWPIPLIFICPLIATFAVSDLTASEYSTYKVTIDETVIMSEFMERYDILDQDGLIYIVRDKEIEE